MGRFGLSMTWEKGPKTLTGGLSRTGLRDPPKRLMETEGEVDHSCNFPFEITPFLCTSAIDYLGVGFSIF